jgi:GR25 family glycosyltransferase involved in LPS biosynthesis
MMSKLNKLKNMPKFYVINMKRSTGRLKYITNLLSENKINYKIVEAIDGKNDNVDKLCAITHTIGDGVGIEWSDYTINVLATTISHLKAINAFIEDDTNKDNHAIIAEDDLAFDFCEYWKFTFNEIISKAPSDWQIIQLSYGTPVNRKNPNKEFSFVKGYGYFTTAYLIKRSKAVEYSNKFFKNNILQNNIGIKHGRYIADYIIYDHAITYAYFPSLFTYRDNNESFIHPEHISVHVMLKNNNRALWQKCP